MEANENTVTQEEIENIYKNSELYPRVLFGKCYMLACKLPNGFIIVESSACVDVANFDIKIGAEICIERIKNKIWELEGYKLQCKLSK